MSGTSVEQLPIQDFSVSGKNSHQQLSKPRVAAYCRVSTAEELQLGSLENQIINYTNRIRANTDWYFAGIYSDKGKSGTNLENRIGFNRMIRNALNGEIDIIICKSISRFSRNIVDTLDTVRKLNEKGVHVIFERERLNTKDSSSSLILKVLATFAEEESRNTSENIEWALNKRFERGEVVAGSNNLYGYDISKNKGWEIVEEEAKVIREAYALFLEGYTMTDIAKEFIRCGYKKRSGEIDWNGGNIKSILTNERYTGDALSRKTCTPNFRTHKSVKNNGHKPQYYVEDHHQGIVSKEDFEEVQKMFSKYAPVKKENPTKELEELERVVRNKKIMGIPENQPRYPFSSRIICAQCGKNFHRQTYKQSPKWKCATSVKSKDLCQAEAIREDELREVLINEFEKRYNIKGKVNDGLLIKRLTKELSSAEAVRDREQNLLRVELEKYLIAEDNAILKNLDLTDIRAKRIEVEKVIESKRKLWEDFDKDYVFRQASLNKLKELDGSDAAINQILNISFIRAWVIHIKVVSPFLFTIKWIDGKETTVQKVKGDLYDITKYRRNST